MLLALVFDISKMLRLTEKSSEKLEPYFGHTVKFNHIWLMNALYDKRVWGLTAKVIDVIRRR